MTYAREINMPKSPREGLENFIQVIINTLEGGDAHEATLKAVDLLEEVRCGRYDDAMADAKGYSAIIPAAQAKHAQDIMAAGQAGYDQGVRAEKERMAKALGLAA